MNIFTTIKNYLLGVERKTVESITTSFNKTVAELEAHAEVMKAQAQAKSFEAVRILKERAEHEEEALKASKVAQAIKGLLG